MVVVVVVVLVFVVFDDLYQLPLALTANHHKTAIVAIFNEQLFDDGSQNGSRNK